MNFYLLLLQRISGNSNSSSVYSGYKIYSRWVQEIKRDEAGELEALPYIAKCDNPQRYFPVMRLVRSVPGLHWAKEIHEYMAGLECFYKKTFSPDENYIYHLDVAINDFMTRKTKAEAVKLLMKMLCILKSICPSFMIIL